MNKEELLIELDEKRAALWEAYWAAESGSAEQSRIHSDIEANIKLALYIEEDVNEEGKIKQLLSNPAIIAALSNITIVILILLFERNGIVTTKAFNMVRSR